jgi:hypothetical protein
MDHDLELQFGTRTVVVERMDFDGRVDLAVKGTDVRATYWHGCDIHKAAQELAYRAEQLTVTFPRPPLPERRPRFEPKGTFDAPDFEWGDGPDVVALI